MNPFQGSTESNKTVCLPSPSPAPRQGQAGPRQDLLSTFHLSLLGSHWLHPCAASLGRPRGPSSDAACVGQGVVRPGVLQQGATKAQEHPGTGRHPHRIPGAGIWTEYQENLLWDASESGIASQDQGWDLEPFKIEIKIKIEQSLGKLIVGNNSVVEGHGG